MHLRERKLRSCVNCLPTIDAMKISTDANGNRVLRVSVRGARGFSIQTNGNLPRTHRDGVGPWSEGEVSQWVREYGTPRQRRVIGGDR